MNKSYCILISLILLVSQSAWSRWATLENDGAPATVHFRDVLTIERDGSYRADLSEDFTILTEQGRDAFKTMSYSYDVSTTTLESVEAKTIRGVDEFPVSPDKMSNKPKGDMLSAFTSTNVQTVAFPHVNVGSILRRRIRTIDFSPSFPNHFSRQFSLHGAVPYLKGSTITYKSKLPLKIEFHIPSAFKVTKGISEGYQQIEIELLETTYYNIVDEPFGSYPSTQIPGFVISSASSYEDILSPYLPIYKEKLSQELPAQFQSILTKAKQVEGFENQANTVMAEIMERVHYMGDWRNSNGKYAPQDLAQVAQLGSGDCKDFATLTTKILRELGYQAHVALVKRGEGPQGGLAALPVMFVDHVIVYAETNGTSYWLDPTNLTSYTGTRPDISGRYALVLLDSSVSVKYIPHNKPEENSKTYYSELTFKNNGEANLLRRDKYFGMEAVSLLSSVFGKPAEMKRTYVNYSTGNKVVKRQNMLQTPAADSRLPSTLEFALDVDFVHSLQKTSTGLGHTVAQLGYMFLTHIIPARYEMGVTLGQPKSINDTMVIKNQALIGQPLTCNIHSPWFNLTRNIRQDSCDIRIEDQISSFAYAITNDELKSGEFVATQTAIKECSDDFIVIMKQCRPDPKQEL
jgi:hypothetical protein